MARNKNKGFSLIEIIVAIAIMTLLLTPIIKQLAQTMEVNRQAKEQQYANENAEYVLEYFQINSIKTIGPETPAAPPDPSDPDASTEELPQSTNSDIVCTEVKEYNVPLSEINTLIDANASQDIIDEKKAHQMKQCKIYVYDSVTQTATLTDFYKGDDRNVKYTFLEYVAYKYTLDNVKLGSKKTEYSRTVVLDDLENKLQTLVDSTDTNKRYTVLLDSDIDMSSIGVPGLTRDDSGRMVVYEDINNDGEISGDDTLYPSAILVKKVNASAVSDPNQVNMGNMQNLDAKKVAMLTGESTLYDGVFADDFYSYLLGVLSTFAEGTNQKDYYNSLIYNPGILLQDPEFMNMMNKLTTITIEDVVTESCYRISFMVTYEGAITIGTTKYEFRKEYLIKSQDFKYDASDKYRACPDIYVEYQPYAFINTGSPSTTNDDELDYSAHEYILINNKIPAEKEKVKIHLYKPAVDQATKFFGGSVAGGIYDNNFFTTNLMNNVNKNGANLERTKIHILNATNTADTEIYTNINIYPCIRHKVDGVDPVNADIILDDECADGNHSAHTNYKPQFLFTDTENAFATHFNVSDVYDFDSTKLKNVADEARVMDKLFNVTVYLEPVSANVNSVILSGAKGEE